MTKLDTIDSVELNTVLGGAGNNWAPLTGAVGNTIKNTPSHRSRNPPGYLPPTDKEMCKMFRRAGDHSDNMYCHK